MTETLKRLGRLLLDIAWAGVILLLPITSFPLLSRLAGNTMVAPASILPVGFLVLFWLLPYLLKKGTLPRETVPFILFVSIAIVASAFAFFLLIPSYKMGTVFKEETKALLALMIGAAFYFTASAWLTSSHSKLTFTLKLIDISGGIMLVWSAVQGIFIYVFHNNYPELIVRLQSFFSIRGLFRGRMTGFAFEPSWLAQQLNLFYLPFWLAASLTGQSAFSFRLWKFRLENLLLVVGAVILFLSSRIGTLSFLAVLAFLGAYFNIALAGWVQKWVLEHLVRLSSILRRILSYLLPVVFLIAFLATYALIASALVYALSHVDWRLGRFFEITSLAKLKSITANIYIFFNYLTFVERYVYWVGGWNVFSVHPLVGTGLGNAGFYFQSAVPVYGWSQPEVVSIFYHSTVVPNIKSLWVRLLAETGIAGFSAFITWCYLLLRSGWSLKRSTSWLNRTVGWFGIFVLLALVFEGFSTDTFALPYLWISLGIVSAAGALWRASSKNDP